MFDVLPRSLFNGGNGGIQLSYPYDTALSLTICKGVQNHLAPKTLHSYFSLFKLLYASSIHTRSSSPHVTDHVSQLAQEDFVSEQKSQAVMHAMSYNIMRLTFDKRDIILQDHVKKNLELAYFCEKVTLSENRNNYPRSPLPCQIL